MAVCDFAGACWGRATGCDKGACCSAGAIAARMGGEVAEGGKGSCSSNSGDGAMALNEFVAKTATKSRIRRRIVYRCTGRKYRRTVRSGDGRVNSNGYEATIVAFGGHCRCSFSRWRFSSDGGVHGRITHDTGARMQVYLG